ncbi:hypothetical protein C8J57DRAFT_1726052 [Mycena rebaudengoi]|nr:hypothetical protein C8J57DRAFT_1726052 [Mycena rebaudengoi]
MPPIHRAPRPQSLQSYWSDSNLLGATIPLHTLAKPLPGFLYRWQALGIIENSARSLLSKETLDAFAWYLGSKLTSLSTKILVLKDLHDRARWEGKIIVEETVHDILIHLLDSPHQKILH